MSAGSFDDSSNLVDVSSSNNGEKKESYLKAEDLIQEEPFSEGTEVKGKTKKSKGLKGFLKRAKSPQPSPLKSPSKSPLRSPFKSYAKHHVKSHPKSPSKSPSKENLTEEFKNLEQKISEKKSEEWLAFQQMQERIKQTVLKTQTSLSKYHTSQSEDSDEKTHSDNPSGAKWTGFEEEDTLQPEDQDETDVNPSISISWASYDNKQCSTNYLEVSRGLPHLDTTPVPSPPITPAPPVNSRISSMENLLEETQDTVKPQEDVDLLGLMGSADLPPPSQSINTQLNQDLLGLDSFLSPTENQSSDTTSSKTLGGYSYSLTSALTQSEKSSQRSTPTEFDQSTRDQQAILGLDSDMNILGPSQDVVTESTNQGFSGLDVGLDGDHHLEPVVSEPVHVVADHAMQMFSKTIVDDFADLDPMKADLSMEPSSTSEPPTANPFGASSSPIPINIKGDPSIASTSGASLYGSSPQPQASLGIGGPMSMYGSSPQATIPVDIGAQPTAYGSSVPIEQDIMSKIKRMSAGSSPASPAKRQAPKKPQDPFDFVKSAMAPKKPETSELKESEEKDEVDSKGKDIEGIEHGNDEGIGQVSNNPFLTGNFPDTGDGIVAYSNEAFNGSVAFGVSEPTPGDTADVSAGGFGDLGTAWGDDGALGVAADKAPVDLDSAWDTAFISTAPTSAADAWGTKPIDGVDGALEPSKNPFQDDFSTFEQVPFEISGLASDSGADSVNPFMSTEMTDAPVAVTATGANNPFLDFDSIAENAASTDVEKFLLDSSKALETSKDEVVEEMDDFDPFKVVARKTPPVAASALPAEDGLDIFAQSAASSEKQQTQPKDEDKSQGFVLEIKPVSEKTEGDASKPPPIIQPPPRRPRSPQPPRENPFDRESPPEENFAQFEIMDSEKPKEPKEEKEASELARESSKSISTDSSSTEEEEILEPLEDYLPKCEKEGFKLMLRYPTKKKLTGNRYWKNVFVKVAKQNEGPVIKVYNDANDALTMQELPLQPCYSLSDIALQQYDQYGKIHTAKLQYIFYKERVGIRSERITPSFVKKPKATMILDHSPQVSELLKFGCLDKEELILFIQEVENALMNLEAHREKTLTYNKDEVTAELHDEYKAVLDKHGKVLSQKARVRIFVLAFVTGMPTVEIGLNDKRRRGKEVVGRCDIIPIKTEEWIRLENVQFHCSVDKAEFEKTNNIKFHPLDACQFELLRYRVRLRENKELPLQLTVMQILKDRKVEIRCDLLVTGYHSYSKKHGQFPCEDIEVRFPIPEMWIYLFRYERRFGYGSFKSATRKPGKIKGLERLTMMAQGAMTAALLEADVGTAKYEHVYRSVVWRIPRLPVRNQGAYTSHRMKLNLELGPHDDIPESFETDAHVEFTMPCSTVSQSQIRSVSVTNPNPPEKWVRYLAHYEYQIEIEHLSEYPEMMSTGVYEEEPRPALKEEETENHVEDEFDRLKAPSDSDSDSSD